MVTVNSNRTDVGVPVVLWVHSRLSDDVISLASLQQHCEILIVDSIEDGVEMLIHLPVDVLVVDMPVLSAMDPGLIEEIGRCWPYLLCLVLSEEQQSDSYLKINNSSLEVLHMPEDSNLLERHLLTGFGQAGDKIRVH